MSRQVPYEYTRHLRSSSRAAYPSFLSFHETVWIHIKCLSRGLFDAFRWDLVIRTATSDPEIRSNILKSILLNSLSWLRRNVGWCYQVLWLLPVVGTSFYLNSSWCNTIAKRTFTLQYGNRAVQPRHVTYTGMLNTLATSAYRTVMVLTSVIVSLGLGMIPHAGPFMSFAFMCWIDAYYCFEKWIARGLSLASRVRHLEERWAYYFAFGLPSCCYLHMGKRTCKCCLIRSFIPCGDPAPQDPYNPLSSSDTVRYPSPLIPIRLPIFANLKRHHRAHSHSSENAEEGTGPRSPVERTGERRKEPPMDRRKRA
ncbi:etoposide-induced protein 2.4-domain-containing protein [Pisolithus microcarpus]|nr:etoposide-induced protein 2.4-domain-containing protein [Pisolithus microcarpus]